MKGKEKSLISGIEKNLTIMAKLPKGSGAKLWV